MRRRSLASISTPAHDSTRKDLMGKPGVRERTTSYSREDGILVRTTRTKLITCGNGHDYSPENTVLRGKDLLTCLTCETANTRASYLRRRESLKELRGSQGRRRERRYI